MQTKNKVNNYENLSLILFVDDGQLQMTSDYLNGSNKQKQLLYVPDSATNGNMVRK